SGFKSDTGRHRRLAAPTFFAPANFSRPKPCYFTTHPQLHLMTSISADATTTTAASPTAAPGTTPNAPSPLSAVGGALPPHHGKTNSISPMSGKAPVQPAVPSMSGPAIVSSSNVANGAPSQSDHSRRPSSVTISAQGGTTYMPNGGSA